MKRDVKESKARGRWLKRVFASGFVQQLCFFCFFVFFQNSGCKRRQKTKGTGDKNCSSLPPDQCSQIPHQTSPANALYQFPTFQPRDLSTSETLFAPSLDWKATLSDKSGQDQTSCSVNGRLRIGCTRLNGHDGSAQAGDPIQTRRDAGAGPSVWSRKHFGSTVRGDRKYLAPYPSPDPHR